MPERISSRSAAPTAAAVTYDPRRLQGRHAVSRDRPRVRQGRPRAVHGTGPGATRRQSGARDTSSGSTRSGHLRLRLDSGRTVAFALKDHPHLDYGYAVTSHSSQGQTADRVLVHIDTDRAGEQLVNRRLAYVAVSRGRHDAQIYTNDKSRLADTLSREISHRAALTLDASLGPVVAPASQSHRAVVTQGLGIER